MVLKFFCNFCFFVVEFSDGMIVVLSGYGFMGFLMEKDFREIEDMIIGYLIVDFVLLYLIFSFQFKVGFLKVCKRVEEEVKRLEEMQ